ncbi:hypothetical protein KI387_004297 [Taxus chinensis]|uniref:Embryo defective 2410 protein n=1 Tax=Taxus chinensis TaxID=29808 RepID=A0AA38GLH6_TAXCH|nr:hypothetical protein KI387_004297 [Taxus chinensis]
MSCGVTMISGNGNLRNPMAVTCSHGAAMHPLVLGSAHGKRKIRLKKFLHKQFLGIPLKELQTRLSRGQGWGQILDKGGKARIFCCQQRNPFLQAYMKLNEVGKDLERKLNFQSRVQWHFQYPLQDMSMFKAHTDMFKARMGMLKDHISRWREWFSFKGLFIIHFMVVLGVLFLCAEAGAQAYIERRVLPSVATTMGDYLGRKLKLGRVQKLSLLWGTVSLESCSLGPHSEEFSCGELPNIRLQLRPLTSLRQRQWIVKAILVQPHVLIAQKEDWTWLGIPTPLENPLRKHSSNEKGIDPRTKIRRLARERAAIQSAEERNKAARKWAQEGYIFADIEEPRLLDKESTMHAEEIVNCESMNCTEEEFTVEKGFDTGENGIEEQLHHKCTGGVWNESRMEGSEWERGFEHDSLDISFILKMSLSNVKLWLKENMVSPLLYQFRRSGLESESFSQKATMQRRNLDHSAAAARTYFENLDKRQRSDAEDGGGCTVKFDMAEDREKEMEDLDEENGKSIAKNMEQVNRAQMVEINKEPSERKSHASSIIKHSSNSVSLIRLEDFLLERGIESVGPETTSEDQFPKHSSTNGIDNEKGSVYEAVVQPIHELCQTTESCKSSDNYCETGSKESVYAKSTTEKTSAHYSNAMNIVFQEIAGDLHNNHSGDMETIREREGKDWSQNDITWGSSPVLASLRTSRDMSQEKSAVSKSSKFHVLRGRIMTTFLDNFITFVQRMEGYLRNKFKQHAADSESGDLKRIYIGGSEQILPISLDSVTFRGGTLMLLGYGDNEPRIMENIDGHLKFQNRYERMHFQLSGRPKEWRTGYPTKDGGKLFVNAFVDHMQKKWHVNINARDLFAPLFERLLEIPIVWSNGRASGEVHICMSKGDHFPNLHGQLDVRGLEFQVLDTPSSFSALCGSLCFQGQRIFLHNASCIFGEVPLEVSGDFGINPEEGEYHLMCQVPNVEVNALMRTLKAKSPLYPVAGSLKAVFNCQGPLDVPVFVGSAVISKKHNDDLNMPSSVVSEVVRKNRDIGAVAAFDRVPFSYMSANFTFNSDNCMADLYGIRATLADGGEIRGAGNAWICQEGEMDENAVEVNFSGNVHFDNVVRHYALDAIQVIPVKLGDVNIEAKLFGSILRPRYDIKWTAPKAEGSFTDARGEIIISHEAITISSSSTTFDLLTKIQIACPNLHDSEKEISGLIPAVSSDILSVTADLRLQGFNILGSTPFGSIGSSKPMHMKLTGRTKFEGRVVKSSNSSVDENVAWKEFSSPDECGGMKASGLVGEVHLSGIRLNQLLVAPQLVGSLDISPQSFKLDATGRPDESLLIEIVGALHLSSSETSPYDLVKRKVSLSLQKGQLRTNIFFQPGHLASLEVRHLQLDELELASLRGMVQKAEIQLNFQKRRGQGNLSVMRPRFSGVQGESLDLSARWSGDVITIEKSVLEQSYSRYELQGEYVLPGTRDRFPGDREKGDGLLKRAMAGQLGDLISSMGRWRLRLEVPVAEVAEMLPFARLLSRSIDPAVLSRSKELFMHGVQNVGFYAENLKKQLESANFCVIAQAVQGNEYFLTDEEIPEAIQLPGLAELKGRWHGNFDASGGGNGDTTVRQFCYLK